MFAQILRGQVIDAPAVHAALDRWHTELKASVEGYLGTTSGVADDGTFIAVDRFTSPAVDREFEARETETREWPAEVLALVRRVEDLTDSVEYVDVCDPWLYT
jgi:hypothetical protein